MFQKRKRILIITSQNQSHLFVLIISFNSMQNVKETIEYSLEILEAFGIEYMSAEDFRAAKHSQTP